MILLEYGGGGTSLGLVSQGFAPTYYPEFISGADHKVTTKRGRSKFYITKCAFTLAEVLITLGIIGVVAALVLPGVIQNYQKAQMINKLKRSYAVINNALDMAKVEYGTDINLWEFSQTNNIKSNSDYFAEHYMIPYLKVAYDCKDNSSNFKMCSKGSDIRRIYLNSGEYLDVKSSIDPNNGVKRVNIYLVIDGKKIIRGRNYFILELGGGQGAPNLNKNKVMPYGWSAGKACDYYKQGNQGCSSTGDKGFCFALIMCEGWQIKNDYPW